MLISKISAIDLVIFWYFKFSNAHLQREYCIVSFRFISIQIWPNRNTFFTSFGNKSADKVKYAAYGRWCVFCEDHRNFMKNANLWTTANKIYGILFTIFGNEITIEWIVTGNMKKKSILEPLTKQKNFTEMHIFENSSIFAQQLDLWCVSFAACGFIFLLLISVRDREKDLKKSRYRKSTNYGILVGIKRAQNIQH